MQRSKTKSFTTLAAAFVLALTTLPVLAQEGGEEEAPEPNWKNEVGLSYVGTSGNTDTSSFGLDFKSERKPTPWGLNLIATFTRAEDSGVITAEQYFVGARGLRELNDRWSLFAGLSWARDTFGGFENRYIAEVGAEFLAIKTDKHTLSFDGGLTWTSEDQIQSREISPPVNPPQYEDFIDTVDWFGGVLGLTWDWAFSKSASLSQRVLYYPNFDDTSDWRVGSDTSVRADLTKLLALQFSYLVRYRNLPIDDREKTDTTTKVSVVMNF
jgi:putative salt-induced outer membrane protein YdiY